MGSYAFAPQSVIAPLAGLDVVWNTISAPCTLGEKLTPLLVCGCILIGSGATGTSVFGAKEEDEYTPQKIKDTLFRWIVFAYCVVLVLWLAFNILFLMPRSAAPKGEPFETGDTLRGLSLGMTAGSIAGNMFCVKAFVEVLQASIRDGRADYWADWLPYVLLCGAVFFATTNLIFLTKAMREYEALFMGAVFEGSLIVAACIIGCVVFSELDGLESWEIVLYWLSVVGIIAGIGLVAKGCADQEKLKDESNMEVAVVTPATEGIVLGVELNEKEVSAVVTPNSNSGGLAAPQTLAPPLPRSGTPDSGASPCSGTPGSHLGDQGERRRSRKMSVSSNPFRGVPLVLADDHPLTSVRKSVTPMGNSPGAKEDEKGTAWG